MFLMIHIYEIISKISVCIIYFVFPMISVYALFYAKFGAFSDARIFSDISDRFV